MDDCEHFQVAIEMRLHGALDVAGGAQLDAHLASCERCRRFEVTTRRVGETMQAAASAVESTMDRDRVRARVQRLVGDDRRNILEGVVTMGVLMPICWWVFGPTVVIGSGILCIFVLLRLAFTARDRARAAYLAEHTNEDLLRFYRLELERRVQGAQLTSRIFVMNIVITAVVILGNVAIRGFWHEPAFVVFLTFAILLYALSLARIHFVKLPRFRRERAELE